MKILKLIFLMAIILSCGEKNDEIIEKSIPVTITKIESVNVSKPIISNGKLKAESEKMLSFKIGGILSKIFYNEGEYAKKGKIIAELNLGEIQSQVNKAKAGFEKAERDLNRMKSLYKDSVITLEQLQNITTAYDVAKADYETAKFNLNFSVIRAPENGKIFKRLVEENEVVSAGRPIVVFGTSNENWRVKTNVTDRNLPKIMIGDPAEISFDAYPGKVITGSVTEIGGAADPYSGTFDLEIEFSNTSLNLYSGMVTNIKIIPKKNKRKLLIPIESLVNADGDRADIFTIKNGEYAERIPITIGEIFGEKVAVNDSLNFDTIIVDGVEYLTDGAKIKLVN